MSGKTGIAWTEATWNPTVGCTLVSPGCDNCYAARETSWRLRHHPLYAGLAYDGEFTGEVRMVPERLDIPLRWREPRLVFVDSMADLFHGDVPDEFLLRVFETMQTASQHTYQVLTKRPGRMASLLGRWHAEGGMSPLPNVRLGTSVENQRWADIRVPQLLNTPAAVRFLSCEPLLGAIELGPWLDQIDWIIIGGESGPRARRRPMEVAWAVRIAEQADAAHIPIFVKQDSGPRPGEQGRLPDHLWRRKEQP